MTGSVGSQLAARRLSLHRLHYRYSAVSRVNAFLRSPAYVLSLALMTVVSNALAMDLYLYTMFIGIGIYLCFWGDDFLPLMPIVINCYIAPSVLNNPGRHENSIFYPENGGIYLLCIAVVFAACVAIRLVFDPVFGGMAFLKKKRQLTSGMVLLGAAYMLGGLGMENYFDTFGNNLLFAFGQFACVFVMYFFFSGSVRWKHVRKDYLAWVGLCVGYIVLLQLLENYFSGMIFVGNYVDRDKIATGWGMHNNVGGMLAMMIPFPFYLAMKKPRGWMYTIAATGLLLGVFLSCSRSSIMAGTVVYVLCLGILLRNPAKRRSNLKASLLVLACIGAFVLLFHDVFLCMYRSFLDNLFGLSSRDDLFENGMKQFLKYPIFGGSFYSQMDYIPWDWANLDRFSSVFPPRWHNTLVQIAASCGAVGLVAYGIHRIQTIWMLFKKPSMEKLFIALYVAVLVATSLLDCHFFNFGPVLFYSMALAFAENCGIKEKK